MDESRIARAASLLVSARRSMTPIDGLPEDCRPAGLADSLQVQERVLALLGETVGGWKVGVTIGVDPDAEPNVAPLLASLIAPSPVTLPAARVPALGVEAEIAFRFARDLPPRGTPYAEAEILDAVASAHPVIEVVDSRFTDFRNRSKPELMADNMSNGFFVYGPALADWRGRDLANARVRMTIGGAPAVDKTGGNAGGGPLPALLWLPNHLARRGLGIAAGQIVTTGSVVGMLFAKPGDTVVASFDGIGESRVTFTG